jgi:hypothetical protein
MCECARVCVCVSAIKQQRLLCNQKENKIKEKTTTTINSKKTTKKHLSLCTRKAARSLKKYLMEKESGEYITTIKYRFFSFGKVL